MGCKTKKVLQSTTSEIEKIEIASEKKEEKQIEKVAKKTETKQTDLVEQKKESHTDIEVKGKAEINKPLEIFNVENGDTLQSFKVTGNAEVYIRTKTSKSNLVKTENSSKSFTEKLKDFSQNIVEENNIKDRVSEMKKKTKEVDIRTGTFWSFGLVLILGVVALILIALFIYFKNYRK